MLVSSDRTRLLVKDDVSSLSTGGEHARRRRFIVLAAASGGEVPDELSGNFRQESVAVSHNSSDSPWINYKFDFTAVTTR
jgi:hypothetical protein